jgi:hypothetical protein
MAEIRTLRSQNKDLRVAQPSNSFLERFAKNRGKLPILRARVRARIYRLKKCVGELYYEDPADGVDPDNGEFVYPWGGPYDSMS